MGCKLEYIEQIFGETHPEIAENLNEIHVSVVKDLMQEWGFRDIDGKLVLPKGSKNSKDKSKGNEIFTIFDKTKPQFKIDLLSNAELIALPNSVEIKLAQDSLKKEVQEINDLINCLWG